MDALPRIVDCRLIKPVLLADAISTKSHVLAHFFYFSTVKPVQKDQTLGLKTNYRLMQVKSITECSKGSILQYSRPSLSYHLLLRSLFVYF